MPSASSSTAGAAGLAPCGGRGAAADVAAHQVDVGDHAPAAVGGGPEVGPLLGGFGCEGGGGEPERAADQPVATRPEEQDGRVARVGPHAEPAVVGRGSV